MARWCLPIRAAPRTGRRRRYSPDTGLFYINATHAYSVWYLYDIDEKPEGWGGTDRGGWSEALLQAIDVKTGNIKWSHKWEGAGGRSGLMSTAGNLLFAGDTSNNFVALDAKTGDAALARQSGRVGQQRADQL